MMERVNERIEAEYKTNIPREKKDLEYDFCNFKNSFGIKKWIIVSPVWNVVVYTDDDNVFTNLRMRNMIVVEEYEWLWYIWEICFIKNSNKRAIIDEDHNIWMVYGKDIFAWWVLTGFLWYIRAKENNIDNPVFVHWSMLEVNEESGKKKHILFAGAHWSGKTYTTFEALSYIKRKYPNYKVIGKWDDRHILRKDSVENIIHGKTTDMSITLDLNILQNKQFANVLEEYEDLIYEEIMKNSWIRKYFEDKLYDMQKWLVLTEDERKGKIIEAIKNVLRKPSDVNDNIPIQKNIFYEINTLVKKIALPANVLWKKNTLDIGNNVEIDHIVVLYPNDDNMKVVSLEDMANIIAEWATNHCPINKGDISYLVTSTKELLQTLIGKTSVYNYKTGEKIGNILSQII